MLRAATRAARPRVEVRATTENYNSRRLRKCYLARLATKSCFLAWEALLSTIKHPVRRAPNVKGGDKISRALFEHVDSVIFLAFKCELLRRI